MGKGELIELVSSKTKLSKKDSEKALNAVLDTIKDSLKKGNAVRLIPFGSFEVRERKARTGRNPQTGAKIHIRARKVPAFRAGKGLKEVVK
ncbi:MAG: HU family DNA-binding protein [Firmicutes bacterium]|nr:HU family DNA-binding protein [Bacillota bacterium]